MRDASLHKYASKPTNLAQWRLQRRRAASRWHAAPSSEPRDPFLVRAWLRWSARYPGERLAVASIALLYVLWLVLLLSVFRP